MLPNLPAVRRLLGPASPHSLAEPLDRADVHPGLAEVLARDVDLGLLALGAHMIVRGWRGE
jgi:hypothetical protein